MASPSFPGPYRNTVPQSVDAPDPMVNRVKFSSTDVGSRKAGMPKSLTHDRTAIQHTPNMNGR